MAITVNPTNAIDTAALSISDVSLLINVLTPAIDLPVGTSWSQVQTINIIIMPDKTGSLTVQSTPLSV
jgi:hypothetical protein